MKNKVYIFFKSAKVDMFNDAMVVDVDSKKNGIIKAGEELVLELAPGNHILEIYLYNKKKCYAKKEILVDKNEIYLTYSPPIIYTLKGKIKEVAKAKYRTSQKNDAVYGIVVLRLARLIYLIINLFT